MPDDLFVILDLDNCIADDAWRIPMIRWHEEDPEKRWAVYHQLAIDDELGNKELIETPHHIIVCTARPLIYAEATMRWLAKHGVVPAFLAMRVRGSTLKSPELKQEQLGYIFHRFDLSPKNIVAAYDDRQDVVDMYIRNGIWAERRWIHEVSAHVPPQKGTV